MVGLAAGLALSEALDPFLETSLKWPNDLLAPDLRKLAGILSEGVWDGGTCRGVIVGIGLNVDHRRLELPEELEASGTALSRWVATSRLDREMLLTEWWSLFRAHVDDLAAGEGQQFAASFNRRINANARLVRLETVETIGTVGYIEGIDDMGRLLLRRADDGRMIRSNVGELVIADRPDDQELEQGDSRG